MGLMLLSNRPKRALLPPYEDTTDHADTRSQTVSLQICEKERLLFISRVVRGSPVTLRETESIFGLIFLAAFLSPRTSSRNVQTRNIHLFGGFQLPGSLLFSQSFP